MAKETELKLRIALQHLAQFQAHCDRIAQAERTVTLNNTYFDDEKAELAKAKAALRIREKNGQFEQTFKCQNASLGLQQSGEWNWPVPTACLNTAVFEQEDVAAHWPKTLNPSALQSVFCSEFTRQTWRYCHEQTEIEIALDQGKISTTTAEQPLCEVELELLTGEVAHLWQLAELLNQTTPLWLSDISKAERGYALAKLQRHGYECPSFSEQEDLSVVLPRWLAYHYQGLVRSLEFCLFDGRKKWAAQALLHMEALHKLPQLSSKLYRRQDSRILRENVLLWRTPLQELTALCQLEEYLKDSAYSAESTAISHLWQEQTQKLLNEVQLAQNLLAITQALLALPQAQEANESATHFLTHWLFAHKEVLAQIKTQRPQSAAQWRHYKEPLLQLWQAMDYQLGGRKTLKGLGEGRYQRTKDMLTALNLLENPWPLVALTGTKSTALRAAEEYQEWAQEHLVALSADL
ncbi:MAG: hypothetical protein RL217_1216 [Pseudomonadota bacterium]